MWEVVRGLNGKEVMKVQVISPGQAKSMRRIVLIATAFTTVFFWLPLNDPVQQPKLFLLLPIAAWLLGTVAFAVARAGILALPKIYWAYFLFALGVLIAALATDVKYTAFFGESLRSMGALSYLSLVIIALAAMMSFSAENLKAFRNIFLSLGAVLSAYGFLQSTGHDPAHFYSVFSPVIGTLGNPDFMSGTLGVSAIASLWAILTFEKILQRIGVLALFILEVFVIKKTASSQGFLVVAVGLVFLCSNCMAKTQSIWRCLSSNFFRHGNTSISGALE